LKRTRTGNGNGGRTKADISIFGRNRTTPPGDWAKMNLAIRGIDSNLGKEHADSFHRDLHSDLKADYVSPIRRSTTATGAATPEGRQTLEVRHASRGNANYAWVQHFSTISPPTGMAGFVLANGSMSSNQSAKGHPQGDRRGRPGRLHGRAAGQLFYSTQIPSACGSWPATRRTAVPRPPRPGAVIDARKMGTLIDRVHRELSDEDIQKIADTYQAWRGDKPNPSRKRERRSEYADVAGFCKSAALDDIRQHGHILTPGRTSARPRPRKTPSHSRRRWPV